MTIAGNVPLDAGLSSSASVEVATALAVLGTTSLESRRPRSPCSASARKTPSSAPTAASWTSSSVAADSDHAVMIDCRWLEFQLAPIPPNVRIVICNSMVRHTVAEGEYNSRRAEIEAGADILRKHRPEIMALRDATVADLNKWGSEMPPSVLKRCRHVVTENARVLAAADAFRVSNLTHFGELMRQAHISLRDDFEASCKEIDILVALAGKQPGCFGARLTGGGFGGCAVIWSPPPTSRPSPRPCAPATGKPPASPRRSLPAAPPAAPTPLPCRLRAWRLS